MKKLLTIMISCTLALASSALAQQDEASPADQKKHKGEQRAAQGEDPGADQARPGRQGRPDRQAQPGNEAKPTQNRKAMRQERAAQDASAPTDPATKPMNKKAMKREEAATEDTTTAATETDKKDMRHGKQMKKERNAANETATGTSASTETAATAPAAGAKRMGKGKGKKPDAQVVAKVKSEHANFKAQPKPEKVPAVTFQQNYRLTNADSWQGPQYEVFRSYHPERHDRSWYSTRYNRIEIIAGGAYYFNNGYWFPAWGYNPSAQYYAYDAPIYVGSRALPPDRVIAEVQAILQQEGYYRGEVDGLLGPLTREALIGYQTDNGLYATATIDEPTLVSLNLG